MKNFLLNLFAPSTDSLLAAFTRHADKLEKHAERRCKDADTTRMVASTLRQTAAEMDVKANAKVDEACRAVRAASRIRQLAE